MKTNIMTISYDFEKNLKESLKELISGVGEDIEFEDDTWVCNKMKKSSVRSVNSYSIYFRNTPKIYGEWIRYYALIMINKRDSIKTIKNNISDFITFLNFIANEFREVNLDMVDNICIRAYEKYLNTTDLSEDSKEGKWCSVSKFYRLMKNADGMFKLNPVYTNPFKKKKHDSSKYIKASILDQTDVLFKSEDIPIHLRCIYWILRFIPSRIGEVMEMELESIHYTAEGWILKIPSWKENGGYSQPEFRLIRFKKESMESNFLLKLIKEQQKIARELQVKVDEEKKGYFFTYYIPHYNSQKSKKIGRYIYTSTKDVSVASTNTAFTFFRTMGERYNIKDEDGKENYFTSHNLRHNGITDRLAQGFEDFDIKQMTLHKNVKTINDNYSHIDKELIVEKQKKAIKQDNSNSIVKKEAVYFKGRILNLDATMEKRLLANMRAHKVKYGICRDITTCKNSYECLDNCQYFIPNVEDLEYFEEQVRQWEQKLELFKNQNHKFMIEKAKHNLSINKKIVIRIEDSIKDI